MAKKNHRQKVNPRLYLKNNWQLYAMLVVPVVYMVLFNYKPMLGVVVAFKKFNIFQGIWSSPWIIQFQGGVFIQGFLGCAEKYPDPESGRFDYRVSDSNISGDFPE